MNLVSLKSKTGVIDLTPNLLKEAQLALIKIVSEKKKKMAIDGFPGLLVVIDDNISGIPLPIPNDLKNQIHEKVTILFDLSLEEQKNSGK